MEVIIPLSQGKQTVINAESFHRIYPGSVWYAQGYVNWARNSSSPMRAHRRIVDAPRHMTVDHIDGDPLNNRLSNLRLATQRQQNYNSGKRKGCTSLYKGVSWDAKNKNWMAMIRVDKKRLYLGRYTDEIQAALAFDNAAKVVQGEYARLNFPAK